MLKVEGITDPYCKLGVEVWDTPTPAFAKKRLEVAEKKEQRP